MGPKFKALDGKEFDTREEWRDYMMLTFYSFKNRSNEAAPLIKTPGQIDGQVFDIADCDNVTIVIMDVSEQVQIDNVKNSKIFIGACCSSIFIRNCENCTFYTCCRQLRLREVVKSTFYIYSMSEVHIEFSNTLKFAPFNGGYPEHASQLATARLDIKSNLWYDIFDHNDPAKTHSNWSLLPEAEYEAPWFPAGPCAIAIPRTTPGSVHKVVDTGMQSFNAMQLASGVSASIPKTENAPPAPPAATKPVEAKPPSDDVLILKAIAAFASFKGGDDITFSSPDFSVIMPSNLNSTLEDIAIEHLPRDLWHIENVSISANKDMAWAVFWVLISNVTIARHTAVLAKTGGASDAFAWKMIHVHGSSPVALAELEVPKKLNLD